MSGLSTGGLTNNVLYSHHHTGNDFPKVNGQDLNMIAGIGTSFPVNDSALPQDAQGYSYSIFTNGSSLFVEPNLSFFNNFVPASISFGEDPFHDFNNISFVIAGQTIQNPSFSVTANDLTFSTNSSFSVQPSLVSNEVNAGFVGDATSALSFNMQEWTATVDFALKLPDAGLPSPIPGMIAFDGSDFRGVDSSGTWKTFTLT